MKKALVLLSSPRRGSNSTVLAEKIMEGIKAAGGESEVFNLNEMSISPCQACDSCRQGNTRECVFDDDMQLIYPKLEGADAFVFASPVYMFNYSAQLKLFLDRCYANLPAFKGKRAAVALAYADEDENSSGAVNAINALKDQCDYTGTEIVGIVHGSADKEGEISSNKKLLEQAFDLGKRLLE